MINNYNHFYLVGIKGVGMASLAILLKKLGNEVTGSDVEEEFQTDQDLRANNIPFQTGFVREHISPDIDVVITTGAHNGLKNIEVVTAQELNIPVMTHAQAIGELITEFKHSIAVCGSHGKTTTTAWIHATLRAVGKEAAGIIGAANSISEKIDKDYIVVEADEYVSSPGTDETPRFMYMYPNTIVATNIDYDHPDVYRDIEMMTETFKKFFANLQPDGTLIYCKDNELLNHLASQQTSSISYGLSSHADLVLSNIGMDEGITTFQAAYKHDNLGVFKISLYGDHNVLNAGAVIATCLSLGIDAKEIKKAIMTFKGSKRRFEMIYKKENTYLFDDYAHHPAEIKATIQAFRGKFPQQKIVVIFQSHTLSRTLALEDQFIEALSFADKTCITDIFLSAREKPEQYPISAQKIVEDSQKMGKTNIEYVPFTEIGSIISSTIKPGDITITMGAGDLYKSHFDIIKAINKL